MNEIKPGWKSSELWLTCGAQISAFVVALNTNDMTAKIVTGLIGAISIAGYLYTRHQLKMSSPSVNVSSVSAMAPILLATLMVAFASTAHAGPRDAVVRMPGNGGSGTVIATGDGWSYILTCRHCFESSDTDLQSGPDGKLKLPHPAPGAAKRVRTKILALGDLKTCDLALIRLDDGPLPYVTPVAPFRFKAKECWSVGFDEMKEPSQCRPAKIQSHEDGRYFTDSRPWHGRSGGALIDKETGYLVGVVSAYTGPRNHAEYYPGCHGVHVALPTIHRFLIKAGVLTAAPGDLFEEREPFGGSCPGGICPRDGRAPPGCPRGVCPRGACPDSCPQFGCPGGSCPRRVSAWTHPVWPER